MYSVKSNLGEVHFCHGEGGVNTNSKEQEYDGQQQQHDDGHHRVEEYLCRVQER